MLTLCQMKIKENLLNNTLQNLEKLFLPTNLKQNLQTYYRSTIKGFLPDPKSLRSFVSNPLKSHLRLQCTMKRIDHETETSSAPTTTTTTTTTSNPSGPTYVLYLEYLGGLIPLLTAKRVSKICPDFIIFDPQMKSTNQLSVFSSSKTHSRRTQFSSLKSRSNTFHQMSLVPQPTKSFPNNHTTTTTNRTGLITNRNSIYVAENDLNINGEDLLTNRSSSGCSSENDEEEVDDDEQDLQKRTQHNEKRSRKKTTKIVKHKHVSLIRRFLGIPKP